MKLKRIYNPAALAAFRLAKAAYEGAKAAGLAPLPPEPVAPPVIAHAVVHTGLSPEQNFDDGWFERGLAAGWMALSGDRVELKTDGEPLRYTLRRGPGYYCKSTGEPIEMAARAWLKFRLANDSSESRPAALAWLAAHGKAADDYDISVTYQCVLDADQHERLHGVRDKAGNPVAAHTLED